MGYLRRQVVTSVLTANAVRPLPFGAAMIPSTFAGWFVSELSTHLLAVTAADTALEGVRRDGSRHRAALGLANLAGLAYLMRQGGLSQQTFEAGLVSGLGENYRAELESRYTDLDWATPIRDLVWPFRRAAEGVEVLKDIPYAPENGRRGLLDIYRPTTGITDAPVLLQVHGGAWTIGTKDTQGLPLMRHMASRGWVCVAINYRLSPRSAWPDHIVDVKRAIAWTRQHGKEYGANPDFIAITGGSAGGHLATLAALTPNDPEYQPGFEDSESSLQAAVPFYGVYDMAGVTGTRSAVRLRDRFLAHRVFFQDPGTNLEPFETASPILRVRKDAPPFYVIHGANDTLVPVDQARQFVRALREVSDDAVAYSELSGAQHIFDLVPSLRSQHSVRAVDRFLRWSYDSWRGLPTASDEQLESQDLRED